MNSFFEKVKVGDDVQGVEKSSLEKNSLLRKKLTNNILLNGVIIKKESNLKRVFPKNDLPYVGVYIKWFLSSEEGAVNYMNYFDSREYNSNHFELKIGKVF